MVIYILGTKHLPAASPTPLKQQPENKQIFWSKGC